MRWQKSKARVLTFRRKIAAVLFMLHVHITGTADRIELNIYESTSVLKEFGICTSVLAQTSTLFFYEKPFYKKVSLIFAQKKLRNP